MESRTASEFFGQRGFELRFSASDGFVWADLYAISSSSIVHAKYGRGADEVSAAAKAVERWLAEQGTDDLSPFTWGDAVRVVASAPADYRPSSTASVVGMRLDPQAENTVLVLIEFGDGSAVEVPSAMLEPGA